MTTPAIDKQILLVTGITVTAEQIERPMAYQLAKTIALWLADRFGEQSPLSTLVCSDLLWINHPGIRQRPCISLGGPAVNAATAALTVRLPTVAEKEQHWHIQYDLDMRDHRLCLWGMDRIQTADALRVFEQRYLDHYLNHLVLQEFTNG